MLGAMNQRRSPYSPLLARVAVLVAVLTLFAAGLGAAPRADEILGGKLEKKVKSEAETKAEIARLLSQIKADPRNYRLHYELGNAYQDAGNEEKARTEYENALDINPKYLEAMVNLGVLYSDLERHTDAIPYFEKALGLDPKNCKARSNLGNSYYAQERYPDAIFEYKRAISLDPTCYSALYNMAVAFADAGLFREAVQWWEKVERAAPGTEAARSARENINLLSRFTQPPAAPAAKGAKTATPEKTGKP
jgi:tetratricopeptide (TPR) repeat protein